MFVDKRDLFLFLTAAIPKLFSLSPRPHEIFFFSAESLLLLLLLLIGSTAGVLSG